MKKLLKGVKGIFKVLNQNYLLPSPRMDSEDEVPVDLFCGDANDADSDGAN